MTLSEWKDDFKGFVKSLSMPRDDYKGIMEYIDEVPEPHWIPVTERLPKKEGFYLVTLEHKYGDETNIRFFKCESGERYWSKWGNETITAWMPLPEPYKGVTE